MKVIRVDDLKSFCLSNEIFQSSLDGQLIVKIGETDRGDDKYELLIDHVPIVDAKESEWIPVSERLPSDCGCDWVLAQIQEPDTGYLWIPCVAEYRKRKDDWYSDANDVGWLRNHEGAFKVIAWMPLPLPYKEGEE